MIETRGSAPFNAAAPGPIGGTTPDAITGTTITATTKFLAANGAQDAPSYSFTGDPDTGIYSNGGNTIRFSTGGTQSKAFDSTHIYNFSNTGGLVGGASSDASFTRSAAGLWLAGTGAAGSFAGSIKLSNLILTGAAASGGASTVVIGGTTQATIGANGAASALTANPLGYITANVAGTAVIIPYYNA